MSAHRWVERRWDFEEALTTSIFSVRWEVKLISGETGEGRVSDVCRKRRRENGKVEVEAACSSQERSTIFLPEEKEIPGSVTDALPGVLLGAGRGKAHYNPFWFPM